MEEKKNVNPANVGAAPAEVKSTPAEVKTSPADSSAPKAESKPATTETHSSPAQPAQKSGSGSKTLLITCGVILLVLLICGGVAAAGLFVVGKRAAKEIDKTVDQVQDEIDQIEEDNEEQSADNEEAQNNPVDMSAELDLGGIVWKVTEAKDLGSELPSKLTNGIGCTADGKYVQVKLSVKNSSEESKSVYDINLVDGDGTVYDPAFSTSTCVDASYIIFDTLEPGKEISYTVMFDVPTDASGLMLEGSNLELIDEALGYIKLDLESAQ